MTPAVSNESIEIVYDMINLIGLFGRRLSLGDVTDKEAAEMSWLMGRAKRRLDPIVGLLEHIQDAQERAPRAPQDEVLALGAEILGLMERFKRQREARA